MSDSQQWYYARDNQQLGPVDTPTLRNLIASGQVQPGDLVWRDGMANWQAVSTLPELQSPSVTAPGPQSTPPPAYGAPLGAPTTLGYQAIDPATQQLQSQANTAMIVGIISIVLGGCICGPAGIGLGIWAWISGSRIPPGYPFSQQGKTGMICGIIGTILGGISMLFGLLYFIGAISMGL